MAWEVVIGLETHAQLSTASKIFSGASTRFGAEPNTQACAVDLALPGVLPVLNRGAVERAIRFGLAVGGKIASRSIFARKNYFYPDLPKGYQISQYELPVVQGGSLTIMVGDVEKTVRLTRAHLEEDAGKSLHEDFHGMSGIDLNRAGTPLLEIVTEPDMRSAEEAVAYAKTLHSLVRWIGICDGNMQEGSFRCDANVSVRRAGEPLGTRCEIKNLNSFNFMDKAIKYEVRRQIDLLEDGGKVVQETRLYDPDKDETRSMRSKEDAMDYRYFPDPDLLPLEVTDDWKNRVRKEMPESPDMKRNRFVNDYSASAMQARLVTPSREFAEFFEAELALTREFISDNDLERLFSIRDHKARHEARFQFVLNWMLGKVSAALNRDGIDISQCKLRRGDLARLISRHLFGEITAKSADEVFAALWTGEDSVDEIIAKRGLKQISDSGEIEKIVDQVLASNAQQVADYKSGKEKAFNSLVGQVMKATKGKANPAQVNALLKKKLDSN
jgi:aspartyl-tRNA(Asn)/glutamyl-tRNA(Gln) amidotransferase subunit B